MKTFLKFDDGKQPEFALHKKVKTTPTNLDLFDESDFEIPLCVLVSNYSLAPLFFQNSLQAKFWI